jgi:shikimate dehydrogenase
VSPIRGTTRVVAILGDPVTHSLSPSMHNAAFSELGLDYVYVALHVLPANLGQAIQGVRALGFAGLNVTVPHKEAILSLLDDVSPSARAIGAVNTVVRRGRRLRGENTDGLGFLRAVAKLGMRVRGKRVVLLGAGGSARAVAWALARAGIARLTILNRHPKRAAVLANAVRRGCNAAVLAADLASARSAHLLEGAELVVNCTSLGLDGRTSPDVEIAATPAHCLFYDLVYRSEPTPLVIAARRQGRRAENGLGMLLEQAALAFRIWTGRAAPFATMERALQNRPAPSRVKRSR